MHIPLGGTDKNDHHHGAPRKGALPRVSRFGFLRRLSTHLLYSMFKASSKVSHKRIRMRDNARPRAIANPALTCHFLWYTTAPDLGGQQRRPDDNSGRGATKATFRG